MKCTDFEKRIYLYDELTTREREQTNEHLKSCESCSHTMRHVTQLRNLVSSHRSHNPLIHDPSLMTRRIMNAIAENQNESPTLWEQVTSFLNLSPMRYAMAAFSIFLVSMFVAESTNRSEILRAQTTHRIGQGPKTVLNLASFHSAFLKTKQAPEQSSTLFANCFSCLRHAEAGCEPCTKKFVKP